MAKPKVYPVIVGVGIGDYALARAFHEQYGARTTMAAIAQPGAIAGSKILDVVPTGKAPEQIAATLAAVAVNLRAQDAGAKPILLTNSDWVIPIILDHRPALEAAGYLIALPPRELIEQVSDKVSFGQICERLGIATPRTVVQNFTNADDDAWAPAPVSLTYPMIAKPARSADYYPLVFDGKKKVFEIATPQELDSLLARLREAGFRGRFLVQERIPGDDTHMRVVFAYGDSSGRVTMRASGRVLLEDHTPAEAGTTTGMITEPIPEVLDAATRFMEHVGWHGFGCFDVKQDPRDGRYVFLEMNTRIGRSNYAATASGVNPARFLTEDVLFGQRLEPATADREVLYHTAPVRLIARYVFDGTLRSRLRALRRSRRVVHPLRYAGDRSPRRIAYARIAEANHWRKYKTYYPLERARPRLVPVIVGGDVGVYSLARAFHEAYGVRSVAVSETTPGPIAHSRILDAVTVSDVTSPEALIPALTSLAASLTADEPANLLLFGGDDSIVRLITENRDPLEAAGFAIPGPSLDVLLAVTDKSRFAELAREAGACTPRTVEIDLAAPEEAQAEGLSAAGALGWPVVAKPATSSEYEHLAFMGKKKVYTAGSAEELAKIVARLRAAGFAGTLLVQELIPGDETQMRSVTAYVDTSGRVTMLSSARVLLGEHTPSALGNTAAAITEDLGEIVDQAAAILTASGYTGFANFDIKVDPRDECAVFFEVNPRIGRPNYYATASGVNPAEFVVRDVVDGEAVTPVRGGGEVLFSVVPLPLLRRYLPAELRKRVRRLARRRVHPLAYWSADGGWRRRLYVAQALLNQFRKFRRWYPKPTPDGF